MPSYFRVKSTRLKCCTLYKKYWFINEITLTRDFLELVLVLDMGVFLIALDLSVFLIVKNTKFVNRVQDKI